MLAECPVYQATSLQDQPNFAGALGVNEVWIKNEAERMGLGSFKALGGAYAIARMIMDKSGIEDPMDIRARATAAEMTFITASAGNHGLSVAAGAKVFGANSVIVLSETVPESFADRIRAFGATVERVAGSYEDSVDFAVRTAQENQWLLLADGSWPGYEERPALIMEGYTALAEECRLHFEEIDKWPTHVFLQAGVGGLAGAVAAHIRDHWAEQPVIAVVEPTAAPCLLESVKAGQLTTVEGPVSDMGRLDCKDASLIAFSSLKHDADWFITITEEEALSAVTLWGEHDIATTSSGGAGLAGLKKLAPGEDSRCLLIVSEGATN